MRRRGRHQVVEEAALLVVGDEQRHLAPHVGVGGEDVDDLRDVPGAEVGLPVRVLGVRLGRDDPRHLRQPAVAHVVAEDVQQRVGVAVLRLILVPVLALSASGVPGRAFWYWWK